MDHYKTVMLAYLQSSPLLLDLERLVCISVVLGSIHMNVDCIPVLCTPARGLYILLYLTSMNLPCIYNNQTCRMFATVKDTKV